MNTERAEGLLQTCRSDATTTLHFLGYLLEAVQDRIQDYDGNAPSELIKLENAIVELFNLDYELKKVVTRSQAQKRLTKLREFSQRSRAAWEVIKAHMFEVIPQEI